MRVKSPLESSLAGRIVALPESRQLDLLAEMFERRGAAVVRVPLVAILDSPRRQEVETWLREFIRLPPDYLVVLTGEGIRRLTGVASRTGCLENFVKALSATVKVCRGPKPGRALRELGLKPDLHGLQPTTAGIIAALDEIALDGRRVAVQLYGEEPNRPLIDYLGGRGATVSSVAPYVYASKSDDGQVLALIDRLAAGAVDVIAFTSKAQVTRLFRFAETANRLDPLRKGLGGTLVAAVGPVVAEQLKAEGVGVAVCPEDSFFMKPMVREIERFLESGKPERNQGNQRGRSKLV
jgi:uroporphyrinogen-III synthase